MYNTRYRKLFVSVLCIIVLLSISCSQIPQQPELPASIPQATVTSHVRKMETPPYGGGEAVIFILDNVADASLMDTADKIIRIFGENNVPLNMALAPPIPNIKTYDPIHPVDYFDVGIIDISIDGYSLPWLPQQASSSSPSFIELKSSLIKAREQFKHYFGQAPVSCIFPTAAFNETNYNLLQQSGFKVICSPNSASFSPSIQPTNWSGKVDPDGLYRLPIVGSVESDTDLLGLARRSIDNMGVACIQIQPAALQGKDGKVDPSKLAQLSVLINSCQKLGQITTLENWYKYNSLASASLNKERPLPPYSGGAVIIFRLDDVSKGYLEDVVQEIIKVFQANGVPVDCGVVSNAGGVDSYKIPWLKQYFDQNSVGISIHGYDWTYYQLDTVKSKLSYDDIKSKLIAARHRYLEYFGIIPVALTVPTDYYDETGYRAINDAGYKIFATQINVEPHPSTIYAVDYFGMRDPTGMYRIPTASDVCAWDNTTETWKETYDINPNSQLQDYCGETKADNAQYYNDFSTMLCSTLSITGVVAIGIHPSCFIGKNGKPDQAKLEKLNAIVKWCKSFATVLTFEQWYLHQTSKK
jgi:peptidoglycan/xylan/chitin deacetylase (PgdA/CDA1 family)